MPAASPPPAPPAPPPATRPQPAPIAPAAELKPRQPFTPPPPPPAPAVTGAQAARGPSNLGPAASLASQAAVRDHPLVKQAVEAFSARIIDVREPTTDAPL